MPFTRRLREQPLYLNVEGHGEVLVVEGLHVDNEALVPPDSLISLIEDVNAEGAPQSWIATFEDREVAVHLHMLSRPSDVIVVPEPSAASSLLVGALLVAALMRGRSTVA